MTIRLGIAPIGWTNDDLPELGGDIPLERCLREARAAGYAGVEKGGKFPLDPQGAGAAAPGPWPGLVSGWFSGGLLELEPGRGEARLRRSSISSWRSAARCWSMPRPRDGAEPDRGPVADRPKLAPDDIRRYGEKLDQARRLAEGAGLPDDLPSPHGHGDRDRAPRSTC